MAEHAKLSPSSSDRWLACPATLVRAVGVVDEGSDASAEGTAAHALAERCLKNGTSAAEEKFPSKHAKWDSPTMRAHVQTYLDYVRSRIGQGELFIEQRLDIFEQYGVWGTADAVIVHPDGIIEVIDLKYGQGVLVGADDNSQLTLYAIGGLGFDWLSAVPIHTVRVHIVQPRRNNFPSQEYPVEVLAEWVQENKAKVERAHAGTDEAHPGLHCRWCPVKGKCVERAQENLKLASFDFSDPDAKCQGNKDELGEEELVRIFVALPQIRQYLDDVEAEVAKRAHEHDVPGTKWIAGRAVRKIIDPKKAEVQLREAGIDPMAVPKMLGLGDLEALLKPKKLTLEGVLGDNIRKSPGKAVLVSADHKSAAIDRNQAAKEDFS